MGRLTATPEHKQTSSGISVARFTVAVNRRFAKEGQPKADFINCIAWRQTADFICKYFDKGSMIAIVGSIQTRSWEAQDGTKRYATEVISDEAYFTGEKKDIKNNQLPNSNDFDDMGFTPEDSSEDDLPF